jgi:hypothetical protein
LLHGILPVYISLHELLALRDEAFRMIEYNCVDHIIAFHLLKKELQLRSSYDHQARHGRGSSDSKT